MAETCTSCGQEETAKNPVDRRFSFGIYAGLLCAECAFTKYRDHCGLAMDAQGNITEDGEQGDQSLLDEPIEAEDY